MDFYYEDGKPVLNDFSLTVRQGETIALVGPTGGGKSTIVNLLCRFYEPKKGDDPVIWRMTTRNLPCMRSNLASGLFFKHPIFFPARSARISAMGNLDATDEEVEQAAQLAGAHDFIITSRKGI